MRRGLSKGLSSISQIARQELIPPTSIAPGIAGFRRLSSIATHPDSTPSQITGQEIRRYSKKSTQEIKTKDIKIVTLLPDSEEDFQTFKKIITSEKVVFTSSWIDSKFGINKLRNYCSKFELELQLAAEGDGDAEITANELKRYKNGESPIQMALDRFFRKIMNDESLREVYSNMTSEALSDLGYYKFLDKRNGTILGGGALVPLEKVNESVTKVDIALHILEPQRGIGTVCLDMLLNDAFEKHKVKQVWGSSIIEHLGTPTLCARHGMTMQNIDGKKYYLLTDAVWEANKGVLEIMKKETKSAADKIFAGKGKEGGGGRY